MSSSGENLSPSFTTSNDRGGHQRLQQVIRHMYIFVLPVKSGPAPSSGARDVLQAQAESSFVSNKLIIKIYTSNSSHNMAYIVTSTT